MSPAALDLDELRRARPAQTDLIARTLEARVRKAVTGTPIEARIDRFVVLERLGSGAMGCVFAAYDPKLERKVALKIVPGDRDGRVLAEARSLAKLSHPHVVAVYDVIESDDELCIAMELVTGTSLRTWLEAAPRRPRAIVDVFALAGRGLAAAHASGIVHGDVKPENILVGDGVVKLADFGLAHVDATTSGGRGTPAYLAPEVRAGGMPDARSDQFAFALALYEAIAGARPGHTPAPLVAPARIARAVARGMATDPAMRFASLTELVAELAPPRSRRWMVAAISCGAVAVPAFALALASRRELCAGGEARVAAVLAPAAAMTPRVRDALGDYGRAWSAMTRASCEATRDGQQSARMLDLRAACLERRLDELGTQVNALVGMPETAAIAAVYRLSPLEPCADRDRLASVPPPPPLIAERVGELRHRLGVARAQQETAAYRSALADVESIAREAGTLRYAPLSGEALLARGRLQLRSGDDLAAEASYRDAAAAAADGSDQATIVTAWTERAYVLGLRLGRTAEALALLDAADAQSRGNDLERGIAKQCAGEVLETADRLPEAHAALLTAVELIERGAGASHPVLATTLGELALICERQGALAEARGYADRAFAIAEHAYGRAHPDVTSVLDVLASISLADGDLERALGEYREVLARTIEQTGEHDAYTAMALGNLGEVLRKLGRDDEARAALSRARTIVDSTGMADATAISVLRSLAKLERDPVAARAAFEDVLTREIALSGAEHHSVADTLIDLGNLARDGGALDQAEQRYTRALAIYEHTLGAEHPRVPVALTSLADVAIARGKFDVALRLCERARVIDLHRLGDDHPDLAYDLTCLGEAQLGRGDVAAASPLLERAVALAARGQPADRARAELALARALWPRDRQRARQLAQHAAQDARPASRRDEIARWLAAHR